MVTLNTKVMGTSSFKALFKAGVTLCILVVFLVSINLFNMSYHHPESVIGISTKHSAFVNNIFDKLKSDTTDNNSVNRTESGRIMPNYIAVPKETDNIENGVDYPDEIRNRISFHTDGNKETVFEYFESDHSDLDQESTVHKTESGGDMLEARKILMFVKEHENTKCRKLPDILIIAFEKCGTMTLRQFLAIHPNIYITNKRGNNKLFISPNDNVTALSQNFTCTPNNKLRLEKLATPSRADLVYKHIPDVKLIAIVREPVERSLSHYLHLIATKKISGKIPDFDTFVMNEHPLTEKQHGVRISYYTDTIRQWIKIFGPDRILFLDGDEFAKNPVNELQKAEKFLGLDPFITKDMFEYNESRTFYCVKASSDDGCMYPGKGRPHPVMSDETRAYLQVAFEAPNEKFFQLIGRRFPWND